MAFAIRGHASARKPIWHLDGAELGCRPVSKWIHTLRTDNDFIVGGKLIVNEGINCSLSPALEQVSERGIAVPTTVYVGHGHQFAGFAPMLAWLQTRIILAPPDSAVLARHVQHVFRRPD